MDWPSKFRKPSSPWLKHRLWRLDHRKKLIRAQETKKIFTMVIYLLNTEQFDMLLLLHVRLSLKFLPKYPLYVRNLSVCTGAPDRYLAWNKRLFNKKAQHSWLHSVWKSPKISHLNFSILAFSTNFCPIKTELSGNSVWLQALGFHKLAKLDHFWHF